MKLLIISSCTKKKQFLNVNQPNWDNLSAKESKTKYLKAFYSESCRAIDMYQGQQHKMIIEGIQILKIEQKNFLIVTICRKDSSLHLKMR